MKYKGLKKIAGESKSLRGFYDPSYYQLFLDTKTREVFSRYHYDLGHNNVTTIHDDNVVCVGFITNPLTQKQIEAYIDRALMDMDMEV